MELGKEGMKEKLINKMGLLAIQIKQHEESASECQKEYEKLNAQVGVLQELENSGVNLTPSPKNEQNKQQEQS